MRNERASRCNALQPTPRPQLDHPQPTPRPQLNHPGGGGTFVQGSFRRVNFRGEKTSPPVGLPKPQLHYTANTPTLRQGTIPAPSLKTKCTHKLVTARNPPPSTGGM